MSKKIYRNILFTALAVFACSMVFIFGGFYHYFDRQQSERLQSELEMAASGAEKFGTEYLMLTDFGDSRVTWVSPEGEVVYDTAMQEPWKTMDSGKKFGKRF